jgi:hypothetical protein
MVFKLDAFLMQRMVDVCHLFLVWRLADGLRLPS